MTTEELNVIIAKAEAGDVAAMNRLTHIYGEVDGFINHEQSAKWFLELIKRDCDSNSGVYENTGYNKELYAKIKSIILNSTTEEEMMSAMSGDNGGSLLGGAISFTTSIAKSYINQAEATIQRNIENKEEQRRRAAELAARKKAEEERAAAKAKEERKWQLFEEGGAWTKKWAIEGSFKIPNGVKQIGPNAFNGTLKLTGVEIPKTVTSIGKKAFYGCNKMMRIAIPNSVTKIGSSVFSGCSELRTIWMSGGVVNIGPNIFENCRNLKEVIVPRGQKTRITELLKNSGMPIGTKIVEQ